ncbi:ECF transporter S component [Eubacterium sp. MSJ-13]|uniref:ECF transporter S component n=1 Tax=Eubacterium sp. MSJ-13 TaxID=2841513 RepID=UPI001C10C6D5|nr:ECF transporter S component [Eubacterium sp. MSJ-13]MBU5478342.1 ECF transporter S component [Eubacterium sp. MSJ-13]
MKNKYVSRRNYDEEKIKKNILKRKISVWLVIIILIPLLLYISSYILRQKHYLFISMFMLAAVMLPFFVSFEYKAVRAREIVLLAMMISFCVSFNLLCAHTIPLHGGSAVVVLSGIALGPEAGFLTGALGRFICNFFDGQGPWTPWQMASWGLMGFISGVAFVRYDLKAENDLKKGEILAQTKSDNDILSEDKCMGNSLSSDIMCEKKKVGLMKNNSSFITLIASVILFETAGYLFIVFTGRDMADTKGIMLYIFGLAGLITGGLLQRKRFRTDSIIMAVFTFLVIFIIYGGIMNFAALIMQNSYTGGTGISLAALKALYITGVPYDIMHAATAALCVFLIGEPFLKKIERVQIKYGIYRM